MNDTHRSLEEHELRRMLRERAALAAPSPHARATLEARVGESAPRPARAPRRITVAAAVAAAVAGLGLLASGTSPVIVTADGGGGDARAAEPVPTATSQPAPSARVVLPRLLLVRDGFVVEHLDEHESDRGVDTNGQIHAQVFRPGGGGPASPAVTVRSIAAGVAFGIGEEAPAGVVERVDIDGEVGFLVGRDALSPSLGIRFEDGSAVHLKGIGVPGHALVELARGMERRDGSPGWNLPSSSMPPAVEGEVRFGGSRSSEVEYVRGRDDRVGIRLFEGDRLRFEDIVLDRADAAETYEAVEVLGHPGVLFGTGGAFVALWHDDGVVGELSLDVGRTEAMATVAALREVTEEEWRAEAEASAARPKG